jgi:hypothetical protein
VHGASDNPEMDEEMGIGPALPVVIRLVDPRPHETTPELRALPEAAVAGLAMHTYAAAACRAVDRPLPPMGKFYSSAELSYSAGLALQAIMSKPWGWEALSRAGFYTVAANLFEEKVVHSGLVSVVADLFYHDRPKDPQRLALARNFLGLGFLQYLLECLAGTFNRPHAV